MSAYSTMIWSVIAASDQSGHEELRQAGLDARPVDEVGIEVPLEAGDDEAADQVVAHAESVIMRTGSSFVPIKHEGTIYIRPPLS